MPIGFYDNDEIRLKGATDETLIGNVGDRLKVDAQVSISGGSVPSLSTKLRYVSNVADVTLTSAAYVTLYTYSGTGLLHGFQVVNDSSETVARLIVDENTIFEVPVSVLSPFTYFSGSATQGKNFITLSGDGKTMDFSPSQPITFSTSVSISLKSTNANRKNKAYFVWITKDS